MGLREDLSLQMRYSIYRQEIVLPNALHDCNNINPDFINTTCPICGGIVRVTSYLPAGSARLRSAAAIFQCDTS